MNFSDIKSNIQITNPKENIWVVKVINKISYFGRFLKYCKQNKARFSKEKDGLIFKYDPVDILSKFERKEKKMGRPKGSPTKKKKGRSNKSTKAKVEPKQKEAWEMTKSEYSIWRNKNLPLAYVRTDEQIGWEHKQVIKQALSENKLVPKNVLADYPELKAGTKEIDIKFSSGGDAIGEEYHGYIKAIDKNTDKFLGMVNYSYWNDETSVKMIEVDPEYRRKGIGMKLLNKLQSESEKPLTVQGDLATEAGQALWNKWKNKEKTEHKKTTEMESSTYNG